MEERNFLQWFNFKAAGSMPVLFLMGAAIHWWGILYPLGEVIMLLAALFLVIYIIIELARKAKKSKWD